GRMSGGGVEVSEGITFHDFDEETGDAVFVGRDFFSDLTDDLDVEIVHGPPEGVGEQVAREGAHEKFPLVGGEDRLQSFRAGERGAVGQVRSRVYSVALLQVAPGADRAVVFESEAERI